MGRTRENHSRMAAILLLAGVSLTEWAGISQFQKIAKGMGQSAGLGNFMLAEGPLPPPGPPPIPHVRFTVS
jgi:hypothetical protein